MRSRSTARSTRRSSQRPIERWRAETPADFRFALKGHRFVTHYKRLRDCRGLDRPPARSGARSSATSCARGLAAAGDFRVDLARLDDFLARLEPGRDVRHALELRHRSWFVDEVADRLRAARIAVCMGDAPDFPMWREVTTDLVYVRLHGHTRKYASSYSPHAPAVGRRASALARRGRDVHVYFDNDAERHAIRNALTFAKLIEHPRDAPPQRRMEKTAGIGPAPRYRREEEPAWRGERKPRTRRDG